MNTSNKFVVDTKQLTVQLGLVYKFGQKKKYIPEPVIEPEPKPAPVVKKEEPKPVPVVKKEEPKPVPVAKEKMTKNVFYTIGKTDAKGDEASKINAAADWMKAHPTAMATVVGYADKGTGTADVNKKIAEKRAVAVADKLKASGVSADRISVDSKGDTVQPFAENDENRVAIITCEEK
ncbi:MAG: OmpA family protein [Bacteroidales bacterium]|nr:OmpA family protein [Bacteroidales bacterium]